MSPIRSWFVFGFALFFPMLLTWIYFVLGSGDPVLQKSAYVTGKTVQFTFPVLASVYLLRQSWPRYRFRLSGVPEGALFGVVVYALIVGLFLTLRGLPVFASEIASLEQDLGARMSLVGLGSPVGFLLLGVFYCVLHSGLEEYYWRWFTFGQLRKVLPFSVAALISSLGFCLHHILILGCYFGPTGLLTWLSVLGILIGGFYWSWLDERSQSISGPWVSHGLVDAALFTVGFIVLFG